MQGEEPDREAGDWELSRRADMKWRVGDVAICITPGSPMRNREVIILSEPFEAPDKVDLVHMVDPGMSPAPFAGWGAERRHLLPLSHPDAPSTWEECVFKPQESVVLEK